MEIRQLQTFRTVAQLLSFSRAAESLNYAQSSVTGQIQALEQELGVPLFERLGKRIVLTEPGERLLWYAEKILKLTDEAQALVPGGEEPAGTLTIGAPESLCTYRLPAVLAEYRKRYPQVQVVVRPGYSPSVTRSLSDGLADLAFVIDELPPTPYLVIQELMVEEVVLLAPADHRLAAADQVAASDLAGEAVLKTEPGCCYRMMLERAMGEEGVQPGTSLEFSSIEAIKQCAIAGMGLALLPRMVVAAELESGRLKALRWTGTPFQVSIRVAWHKDKWLSPAVRAFLNVTGELLAPGVHLL